MVSPLRLAAISAVPRPSPAVPTEAEAARIVDTYLHDASGSRVRMGALSAGIQVGTGLVATAAGSLFGVPGVVVATAAAAGVGIALGLHNARRYLEAHGGDKFMSAYLSCALNGFQAVVSGAVTASSGPVSGVLASLGGATLGGIISGAWRNAQSAGAASAFHDLDHRLDRAIDLEGVVLRNARAGEKAQQPAGKVEVGEDFVTVGGIRVPRGDRPAPPREGASKP